MTKRFSVRKIKVGSYSRQGWLMSSRESFAVIDRMWRQRPRGYRSEWEVKDEYMYVRFSEWNNKDFVKAIADYLNETIGLDFEKRPDGFVASNAVLKRDLAGLEVKEFDEYKIWCEKFSSGFRPTSKFQKV